MKKEKYKVLVDTYFNKDERKSYAKGSAVELNQEKGNYLEHKGYLKKSKPKEKNINK